MAGGQSPAADYIDRIQGHDQVELRGPNVDLSLSIKGRKFVNACGLVNLPDGEIYTGPVENSANGWVRFTYPAVYQGQVVSGIELTFEDGKVVQASAEKNQALLLRMLDSDPGARYLGEFAIGTNFQIDRFTHNILLDEKIGGSFHMAVGAGYPETGSMNKSAIHWDMICDYAPRFRDPGGWRSDLPQRCFPLKRQTPASWPWAHRGGEGQWPSNTLYAFERALDLGMDALEMDIHATRDGVLVMRHDPVVETTTDGVGRICDLTLSANQSARRRLHLDGGRRAQLSPSAAWASPSPPWRRSSRHFPDTPEHRHQARRPRRGATFSAGCCAPHDRLKQVVVGSFHDPQLRRFRLLCPEVDTAAGVSETRRFFSAQPGSVCPGSIARRPRPS